MSEAGEGTLPAFVRNRLGAAAPFASFGAAAGDYGAWRASALALYEAAVAPARTEATVAAGTPADLGRFRRTPLRATFSHGGEAAGAVLTLAGTAPSRAILLLHDHGGYFDLGWAKGFPLPEAASWQARLYGGIAPAALLAEAGFAVVSFDALGWGGRTVGDPSGQQALAANLMQTGLTLAAVIAAEDIAVAGWLARHPFAADGLAALGFSFGGFRAFQLGALSPDVRAAAAISWMGRRADLLAPGNSMANGQSAYYTLHPSLVTALDYPDLAGLVAPRPMFLRTGNRDRHFPQATVRAAHGDIAAIYEAAGAAAKLDAGLFDGAHVCPPAVLEAAVAFLATSRG
ncbi:hydrolase [Acuticoccus sp. MNP-M23]|uniref:alpha/beta hydrolase family protein n=1 Tax=Acuticoccus sp. MNP-M23 TaxID=3072793 RepID=UPI002815D493|nr:hydrolase [Acuticoccus sp. MNP-M23]WMS44016.1 hydrolase [Acuticoccus sp. MNP-M23]